MKMHKEHTIMGLKALRRAAIKVAEDALRNNYKIPIWRDGRIEHEIPEIIADQRDAVEPDHMEEKEIQ